MKRKQRNLLRMLVFSFLTVLLTLSMAMPVFAISHGLSANEVIAAVNSLRAEYGLSPYNTSQELNDICQEQADYMASINTLTHDRADGSSIPTTAENIAYGPINVAMDSWIDDQPHFDTLISWSKAQVGAGVAEAGGYVYICLNIKRYSDTEFNQIPFTQGPSTDAIPTLAPTAAPVVDGKDPTPQPSDSGEGDNPEAGDGLDETTEVTPIAMLVEEGESAEENAPTAEPIEEIVPGAISGVQPQEIAFESRTGKIVAYILMGIGIAGLGGSIYGMMYALRLMGSKKGKGSPKKKDSPPKKNRKKKKSDTGSTQEIPHEAQLE